MDACPWADDDEELAAIFTAIKYGNIVKIEIDDVNVSMGLFDMVSEHIDMATPSAAYDHELLPL